MEGFKVDLLISDKDVAVDAVEGQYSAGEDVGLFEHGFFRYAIDFAHIEGFLIEAVDDHLVYALLEVVVVLLLGVLVQEDDPLLQVLHVLVGGEDGCVGQAVLICSVRSS